MSATQDLARGVDLTVICVTYQSRDHVVECLRSAVSSAAAADSAIELIVVDNASSDGSAAVVEAEFPDAIVIRNETNRGFGTANNQAFEVATGAAWLLLNPDARLAEPAIRALLSALSAEPRLAAVGPSITGAGIGGAESAGMLPGLRSFAGHFLFVNRLLPRDRGGSWRGWMLRPASGPAIRAVEWTSAAGVLLRPSAVAAVGGFDETFFLYGEDTDLSARLLDHGWRIGLVPAAKAWHAIGGSQAPGSTRWIDGLDAFLIRRGRRTIARAACMLIMAIGLSVRGLSRPRTTLAGRGTDLARMRAGARRAWQIVLRPSGRRQEDSG